MVDDKNRSTRRKLQKKESGVLTERVELSRPKSEHAARDQAEEQALLPHEQKPKRMEVLRQALKQKK